MFAFLFHSNYALMEPFDVIHIRKTLDGSYYKTNERLAPVTSLFYKTQKTSPE